MAAYESGQSAGQLAQQDDRLMYALESDIVHPTHTDGFADSGDPVCFGDSKGVCLTSAAAATDKCVVDTGGVYHLSVTRANAGGNVAITYGDTIYIATATAVLSKIATGRAFGIAMGAYVIGDGSAVVIPVWVGGVK